ncbi:uncharacterized protein LOC116134512 [Pistacia vera]|uniref:uncharacterized protein LOC116134512 n=1 Tax=Pistacia vera TaxID=55513 RepID=UPI0012630C6D|nr:uncharacterized protein LOC116134512 [Pistacia vera]
MTMEEPKEGATIQHRRDRVTYDKWKKKNSTTRITSLSSMDNDLMKKYREYELAKDMWSALATKFGGTSIAKLQPLTIKFDTYKKKPEHTMRVHVRHLSNMISQLRDASHVLTNEQQVQAIIRLFPQNWEHMKIHLTHNEGIKNLEDATRHLELEENSLNGSKTSTNVYMIGSNSYGGKGFKRKFQGGSQRKSNNDKAQGKKRKLYKHRKEKHPARKKNMAKVKCYNCGNKGHFACNCSELNKVNYLFAQVSSINVSGSVFLIESHPLWTVDSAATDHITKDMSAFMEFQRIS